MKTKLLSVSEYAAIRLPVVSVQAVRKAIVKGHKLPGVVSFSKVGKQWVLKCDLNYDYSGKDAMN